MDSKEPNLNEKDNNKKAEERKKEEDTALSGYRKELDDLKQEVLESQKKK